MKLFSGLLALPFVLLAMAAQPLRAQTAVYSLPAQETATYPYLTITQGTEYGSAIQLGGTDRNLQSATLSVYSNVARTGTVTFSLYAAIP